MTSEVAGSTHLPPMNSLSHSVLKAHVLCVMSVTLPIESCETRTCSSSVAHDGRRTSTRLLTRNSRSTGTPVIHHAHRGW